MDNEPTYNENDFICGFCEKNLLKPYTAKFLVKYGNIVRIVCCHCGTTQTVDLINP